MTRQVLAAGTDANDGTGDTLRQAAQKINENFLEIYQKFGDSSNLSQLVSFVANGIEFNLGTTFTLTAAAPPTSNRTVLLPDASGTIVLTTADQTLINKSLTSPVISNPVISGAIFDSNVNEIIKLTPTSSAVNEITIINAATGNKPTISATGTNTNVSLNLIPKGSGAITLGKTAYNTVEQSTNGNVSATSSYIICNKASALALTLLDGTITGEFKVFTNKGTGTATITPSSFAQGTSFTLPQYAGAQTVWDGSNWYLVGVDGESDGARIGSLINYIDRNELDSDLGGYISVSSLQTISSTADSFGAFQSLIAAL